MCTDIGVIESGKLLAVGSVEEIASQVYGSRLLKIRLLPTVSQQELQRAAHLLQGKPGVRRSKIGERELQVAFDGTEQEQQALLQLLVREGVPVVSLAEDPGNLEDLFLAVTKGVGS